MCYNIGAGIRTQATGMQHHANAAQAAFTGLLDGCQQSTVPVLNLMGQFVYARVTKAHETERAFGATVLDELLRQGSLQHHTHVRPGQQQAQPFIIARHCECLQAVAFLSLDHRCDHSITSKAAPPWLTFAMPLQAPSTAPS